MLPRLPSVSELLDSPPLRSLVNKVSDHVVVTSVRTFLDELRSEVQSAASDLSLPDVGEMAERIARRIQQRDQPMLRPVINATGVLLHSETGDGPLAIAAIEEMVAVSRDYASLDVNFSAREPVQRSVAVEALLKQLVGAEAALVVVSPAAATLLTLSALSAGREVVVARRELCELDGSRITDVIAACGATLREVGAANAARIDDYRQAIGERTAALLCVNAGSYELVGDTAQVTLEELSGLAREKQLPLIHQLGSGSFLDLADAGLAGEPVIAESLRQGADLVLFPGHKLLGGPECGIIAGRRPLIEQISRHPLLPVLQAGRLTIAALAATFRLYRQPAVARREIPILQLLSTSVENLENRARRLAPQIEACSSVRLAEPIASSTFLAAHALEHQKLPTWCIRVVAAQGTAERMADALRSGRPSLVSRVQEGHLLLDLRTVFPRQDQDLVAAFATLGDSASGEINPTADAPPAAAPAVEMPS